MQCVDVFSKYYSFDKLPKDNKYYRLKKDNYERVKLSYANNCAELQSFPIRAVLQTTDFCNLSCIMCQLRSQRKNDMLRSMRKEQFDTIAEQLFPYLVEVHPTNIGEPLQSEWFEYFCDKVIEYGVLMDITTNGMLLDESKIHKILPNLLDIKVSFDGIRRETFERIRKGSSYDVVVRNIDNLLKIRKQERTSGTVTLQMTLFNFNYRELPEVIALAHEKGVDGVKAYHVFSYSDEINKLSLVNSLEQFEETRMASISLANELSIRLEVSEPDGGTVLNLICQKCRLPWSECWVDSSGEVYPCHSHEGISLGNIYSENFQSIWNGGYAKQLRMSHIDANLKTICADCGMNFIKRNENQAVPHDKSGYLHNVGDAAGSVKWSGRSRQFYVKEKT